MILRSFCFVLAFLFQHLNLSVLNQTIEKIHFQIDLLNIWRMCVCLSLCDNESVRVLSGLFAIENLFQMTVTIQTIDQ